jgi:hypothetical protein
MQAVKADRPLNRTILLTVICRYQSWTPCMFTTLVLYGVALFVASVALGLKACQRQRLRLLSGLLLLLVLVALSLTWNWETYEFNLVNLPTSIPSIGLQQREALMNRTVSLARASLHIQPANRSNPLDAHWRRPYGFAVLFLTEYQRPNCFTSFTGTDGEVLAWILRSYFWPMIPTRPVYGTPRYQQGVARGTTRSFVASHESK